MKGQIDKGLDLPFIASGQMFTCTKCDKREFQLTQLSEMRLLAECSSCGSSFIMDTVTEKRPRVEASDPNQHIIWDWKAEKWIPAKRN